MNTPTVAQQRLATAPMLALEKLTLDPQLQARESMDDEIVREYASDLRRGDIFPPIHVVTDTVHYWLVSGWHRVAAARALGWTELPAVVVSGTFATAEDEMLKTNQGHGKRRTPADIRKAIRRALSTQRWVKRSDRVIATHIGCDHKTVTDQREAMEAGGEIPHVDKVLGEDGKRYSRSRATPKVAPEPQRTSTIAPMVTIKPTPSPVEWVDEQLTECRQNLEQERKRLADLTVKLPGLTRAERLTNRQHWLNIRRIVNAVIGELDEGTQKAKTLA